MIHIRAATAFAASLASGFLAVVTANAAKPETRQKLPEGAVVFKTEKHLKGAHCADLAMATLARWGSRADWQPHGMAPDGSRAWRSPTEQVGVWTVFKVESTRIVELARVTSQAAQIIRYEDPVGCAPRLRVEANPSVVKGGRDTLTDDYFRDVLAKNQAGFVYVWSPRMALSVTGLCEARDYAAKAKLRFVPVRDPSSSETDARKALATHGLSIKDFPANPLMPMRSLELSYRNVTMHYPTYLPFAKGRITGPMLPGYEEPALLAAFLKEHTK